MTGARSDLRVSSVYVPATAAVSTHRRALRRFGGHRKSAKSVAVRQAERMRRKQPLEGLKDGETRRAGAEGATARER